MNRLNSIIIISFSILFMSVAAACSKVEAPSPAKDIGVTVSPDEWNGGETGLFPDFAAAIRVAQDNSFPEGTIVSDDGRTVILPYTAADCIMEIDCPDELELISDVLVCPGMEITASGNSASGANMFHIIKEHWRLGVPEREVELQFRRKGLDMVYPDDRITLVLTGNPSGISGSLDFTEGYAYDFGKYADNEFGVITLPGYREIEVFFDEGEDEWIKLERTDDGNVRIIGGWRPNDVTANGRIQSATLVLYDKKDGSGREEYTISRRNWGLPVTKVNGIWWCKYNAMGNSREFTDQILSSDDPAVKAGLSLYDYLAGCTAEEFFALWKWEYQGDSGTGLQVADIDGVAKLDGYVHGQKVHMNTLDPHELAPDGYEVPSYDDYGRIFNSTSGYVWLMWDGSHQNSWNGGSVIQRRKRYRNDISTGTVALKDLIYIVMYNQDDQTYEPVVWYGPGSQWDNSGIMHSDHYNAMLFTAYSPEKRGWYFSGTMNAYHIMQNGAGLNDTRILRFRKSDVEYIY